ncbi:hypothetical protein [Pedobacter aquae]|nr:hypothetical protein [Pedobacter aquae]
MKKLLLLSFLAVSVLMGSCKKEEVLEIKKTDSNTVMNGAKLRPTYDE